jgi:hypothetical protein
MRGYGTAPNHYTLVAFHTYRRHPATRHNTPNDALENRKGRQALGGSNPSPSASFVER